MDRSDKIGLSAAGAGHVLLLALLSASLLQRPTVPPIKQDTIDVSLVDDIALTSATRSPAMPSTAQAPETGPVEDAAPAPSPEPEPVAKPAPAPPPPPAPKAQPKPEPKAEPKPEPKPVTKPVPKPAPKPVKDAPPRKPTPKAAPAKPRPAKAQPKAPAKPTPAKSAPAKSAAAKPSAKPSATPSKSTGASKSTKAAASSSAKPATKSAASGSGKAEKPRASRLGPNFLQGVADESPAPPTKAAAAPLGEAEKRALNSEISRQLKPKWKAPTGGDVDQLVTVLRWRLNEDGSLASGPELVAQTGKTDTNRPQQQLHVEAAIRAVRAAAPFDLPPQYYSTWKNIVAFRFDKRL